MCLRSSNVRHPALLTAAALASFASLARAGDFNGDGFDDLAIGVPGETVSGSQGEGAVAVIYGTSTGLSASAIPDQIFHPTQVGMPGVGPGLFGRALTTGDFNGDGFDDLAIGNPDDFFRDRHGDVTILLGSPSGLSTAGARLIDPSVPEFGDSFGIALAADDFDGDGFDDLAIGAPGASVHITRVNAASSAGKVHVFYGSRAGLATAPRQVWSQESPDIDDVAEASDRFGAELAAADLIADGTADLAIGVPGENGGAGMVHVLTGFPGIGLSGIGSKTFKQGFGGLLGSQHSGDGFGAALAACPGTRSPLAIGCPHDNDSPALSGSVLFLPHGLSIAQSTFISQNFVVGLAAPTPQDNFGSALALDDFGRFRFPTPAFDLAIGAPGATVATVGTPTLQAPGAGVVFVLYGTSDTTLDLRGAVRLAQGVNGLGERAETGDRFGSALAAGNFGREPLGDLVVGAPGEDRELAPGLSILDTGAVHVLYGSTVAGLSTTDNQTWTQNSPDVEGSSAERDSFGASVSGR